MKHYWLLAAVIGYCLGSGCVCYWLGSLLKHAAGRLKVRRDRPLVEERLLRVLGPECWQEGENAGERGGC